MTTHELANLFDVLRTGLAAGLTKPMAGSLADAAAAFRELPDEPIKKFVAAVKAQRAAAANPAGGGGGSVGELVELIREARKGSGDFAPLRQRVTALKGKHLEDVLVAFGKKKSGTVPEKLARVIELLAVSAELPVVPAVTPVGQPSQLTAAELAQVEEGVTLYTRLRDDRDVTPVHIPAGFEPFRAMSKGVLSEICRRLGHDPGDTKEASLNILLQVLHHLKNSQMRAKMAFTS